MEVSNEHVGNRTPGSRQTQAYTDTKHVYCTVHAMTTVQYIT